MPCWICKKLQELACLCRQKCRVPFGALYIIFVSSFSTYYPFVHYLVICSPLYWTTVLTRWPNNRLICFYYMFSNMFNVHFSNRMKNFAPHTILAWFYCTHGALFRYCMNIVINSFFSCFNSFTVATVQRYKCRHIDKVNNASVHTLYFTSVFVITNNRIFTNLIILTIRLNQKSYYAETPEPSY